MGLSVGLVVLAIILFIAARRGVIKKGELQNLANIAAIVAVVGAIIVIRNPLGARPAPTPIQPTERTPTMPTTASATTVVTLPSATETPLLSTPTVTLTTTSTISPRVIVPTDTEESKSPAPSNPTQVPTPTPTPPENPSNFEWETITVCDDDPDVIQNKVRNLNELSVQVTGFIQAQPEGGQVKTISSVPPPYQICVENGSCGPEDRIRNHYPDGFIGSVWGTTNVAYQGVQVASNSFGPVHLSCGG